MSPEVLQVVDTANLTKAYYNYDFWSAAVIVGVALEEVAFVFLLFRFVREWLTNGWRSILHLAKLHWETLLESPGFIILVAGLVLEMHFQNVARRLEESIRQMSERKVEELKVRASDAELAAAIANGRAATATEAAAKLGVSFDSLHGFVDFRQAESAKSIAALKQAESELAAAIQRAGDEAAAASRHFDQRTLAASQQVVLRNALSSAPKGDVAIVCDRIDPESNVYKKSFLSILSSISYHVIETKQSTNILMMSAGAVSLVVRDPQHASAMAIALQKALISAGVPMTDGVAMPDIDPPDLVWIEIGKRF